MNLLAKLIYLFVAAMPIDNGPTMYPIGYEHFCRRDYIEICSHLKANHTSPYTDVLEQINKEVNKEIKYKDDVWPGEWTPNVKQGDCDDYAVTKLMRLVKAGFPRESLRLAIQRLKNGQYHAVLVADTSRGFLVLSNLTDKLNNMKDEKVQWIMWESISSMGWEGMRKLK